jgi:hypothetical protein
MFIDVDNFVDKSGHIFYWPLGVSHVSDPGFVCIRIAHPTPALVAIPDLLVPVVVHEHISNLSEFERANIADTPGLTPHINQHSA